MPDGAETRLVDDSVVHFILCLPHEDRPDAAEIFAATMVPDGAPTDHLGVAEDIVNATVSSETGRLAHLNPTDRLFVLRTLLWARNSQPSQVRRGWGSRY